MSGRSRVRASSIIVVAAGALAVLLSLSSGSPPDGLSFAVEAPGVDHAGIIPETLAVPGSNAPNIALTGEQIAALPEVRYDAVVPGLIGYAAGSAPPEMAMAYTLRADTPIYGVGRSIPVARFTAVNFLGEKTIVVPVSFVDGWALVLTPARQSLPSAAHGVAPAQTAGWIRTEALAIDHLVRDRIVVSVKDQSLSIVDYFGTEIARYSIGVGTPSTPTPTGVTGYIQARYLDPAQGQDIYPINLTSLHSTAADEPYDGSDGGLIGAHYFAASSGAISHGCLRLPEDAVVAVNRLPIGTPITIAP